MPGYRSLPDSLTGSAAEKTRLAARLEEERDFEGALRAYEEALVDATMQSSPLPGFICGRLAALYRRLGRYDDEVRVLELYRESQTCDQARTRYDARLSKAKAIAERTRKRDTGALASVRAIKKRRLTLPRSPQLDLN